MLLLLSLAANVEAQYFQFSQYNLAPNRVNPAWLANSAYASAGFLFRSQRTGGDFAINSNNLQLEYPLLNRSTGQPWSGVGLSFLDDKVGPLLRTQEIGLGYAVHLTTGKYQTLSLGFRGLFRSQRVDANGYYTASQYVSGHGFDPGLDNGENFGTLRASTLTFSSGVFWREQDRRGASIAQIGFSIFDLNNKSQLLNPSTSLASTGVLQGSWRAYHQGAWSILPDLLWTFGGGSNVITPGGRFQYDLLPAAKKLTDHVDFIARYAVGRSGILGVQLWREQYTLGLSYDFPFLRKNEGNTGALEIGLAYRVPVKPNRQSKSAKRPSPNAGKRKPVQESLKKPGPVPARPSNALRSDSLAANQMVTPVPEDSTSEIVPVEIDSSSMAGTARAGRIRSEPMLIEKIVLHFRFDFNSTDLDDETEKFLDELAAQMTHNPGWKLRITGHTDNVGSASFNERLSLRRAHAVREFLTRRGIDGSRIQTEGMGMTKPLNDNRTAKEQALNRRVEIEVVQE
ncbi:MAG: PorP/SprF family type IX secretion system membrane protein [Cyclobacteriaceae bacterium]|nr:PorP/SprF family type IX secretion system membrane protein [Cyclobacteriaceae bacterium]